MELAAYAPAMQCPVCTPIPLRTCYAVSSTDLAAYDATPYPVPRPNEDPPSPPPAEQLLVLSAMRLRRYRASLPGTDNVLPAAMNTSKSRWITGGLGRGLHFTTA
eukprot:171806-Rhodomonas_salina.1